MEGLRSYFEQPSLNPLGSPDEVDELSLSLEEIFNSCFQNSPENLPPNNHFSPSSYDSIWPESNLYPKLQMSEMENRISTSPDGASSTSSSPKHFKEPTSPMSHHILNSHHPLTDAHLGGVNGKREPDKDAIKMFVGQIPKSWEEANFRKYFEKFGALYQSNILKDKVTNESRGCGFVTYFTRDGAIEAQRTLHDKIVLPGMTHCIQMKPADSENRKERKLFVGMLPKKMNETDVKLCFSKFGPIEECTVLKNPDNTSKGCAFVTFMKKADAHNAIRHMNAQVLEGTRGAELVVKNADSQKDKESKRMQSQQQAAAISYLNQVNSAYNTSQYLNMVQQANSVGSGLGMAGGLQAALANSASPGTLSQPKLDSNGTVNTQAAAASVLASQQQQAAALNSLLTQQHQINQLSSILDATGAFSAPAVSPATLQLLANANPLGLSSPFFANTPSPTTSSGGGSVASGIASPRRHEKQREGPDGSNLFIYHLPADFTDSDLRETFMPFGNVISAKVFIDKNTNLSKCFGFVSYDNPTVAEMAIKAMDGCQVGNKKLKVEHKKVKSRVAVPSSLSGGGNPMGAVAMGGMGHSNGNGNGNGARSATSPHRLVDPGLTSADNSVLDHCSAFSWITSA